MTDEDAFQRAIDDAGPLAETPRLVFADWLDDQPPERLCRWCTTFDKVSPACMICRGAGVEPSFAAERAAGYRALARLGRWPDPLGRFGLSGWSYWSDSKDKPRAAIGAKWWRRWRQVVDASFYGGSLGGRFTRVESRKAADDAAALAWANLDPADRDRILRGKTR